MIRLGRAGGERREDEAWHVLTLFPNLAAFTLAMALSSIRMRDVTLRNPVSSDNCAWLYCQDIVVDGVTYPESRQRQRGRPRL